MRLGHADVGGQLGLVIEEDGEYFLPPDELAGQTLTQLLRNWVRTSEQLRKFRPAQKLHLSLAPVAPALPRPGKILCAGANYVDHMKEMGLPQPPESANPFLFMKPASSVIGHNTVITTDTSAESRLDYEAELGVVIGAAAKNLSPDDAAAVIAGYVVANDVSARAAFRVSEPLGPPFAFDWLAHKGQDGFCPIGPWFTPSWAVQNPNQLAVRTWVNGEQRQNGNTRDMLFSPARLIAFASALTTLEPGDVILTGTPAGVAASSGRFLQADDSVTVWVEGVGSVTNVFQNRST